MHQNATSIAYMIRAYLFVHKPWIFFTNVGTLDSLILASMSKHYN
jgi:hypothetical protein